MSKVFEYLQGDKIIWIVILLLSIISVLVVYSSTETLAYKYRDGNTEYYIIKHFLIILSGLGLMWLCHKVNYGKYAKIAEILLLVSGILLLVTLFFGSELNSAKRWIEIPILRLSFQPSDLAKLAMIMYTARILAVYQNSIKESNKAFLKIIIPLFIICALIAPADLSSATLLFCTCFLLMFIGRIRIKHLFAGGASAVIFALVLYACASLAGLEGRTETWKARAQSFFQDEGDSWQSVQSKIAIANGGLVGNGPGNSEQSNYLPHPYSDFIYAIIIEEYGLLGGLIVALLYLVLLFRSVRIFIKSPKAFGAMLAVGLSISLVVQALMNMAVAVELLPVTGLVLPMISMGGTSLIFTSISIGIILSVSRYIEEIENNNQVLA